MKCRLSKLEFELVVSKSGGGASRLNTTVLIKGHFIFFIFPLD